jgi:hypothetical protein
MGKADFGCARSGLAFCSEAALRGRGAREREDVAADLVRLVTRSRAIAALLGTLVFARRTAAAGR